MTLIAIASSIAAFEQESGHTVTEVLLHPHDFAQIPWAFKLYGGQLHTFRRPVRGDDSVSRGEIRFNTRQP